MRITKPGLYPDLPSPVYHSQHDWLSNSGAKLLLKPSCPAKFKAAQKAGDERKRHFDLGKIVHSLTLGDGDEFEVVMAKRRDGTRYEAKDYDTKAAQAHRDAIYEAGKVPLLRAEIDKAKAMAAAVKAHPIASRLFAAGQPEVSLFWIDEATGVKCRARVDWLPEAVEGKRLIVPDLKTAVSAEPEEFGRNAARFGYVNQHVHYSDGIRQLGIDPDPAFLFAVVEKDDPHVVTVGQFTSADDLKLATAMTDRARRVFRECVETDTWPGYVAGVADLTLPTWWHYQNEEFYT